MSKRKSEAIDNISSNKENIETNQETSSKKAKQNTESIKSKFRFT